MKLRKIAAGLALAGGSLAFSNVIHADDGLPSHNEVCLFAHPNYEGLIGCYGPGSYSDLHDKRNQVSSIRVGDAARIHGFSHPGLSGKDFLGYVNIPKMDEMNDDIDSFSISLKPSQNFACIWEHPGMEGTSTCMHVGDRDSNVQGMKNSASSISIHGNAGLIGYSHGNLTGSKITTFDDIIELDSFDDDIDSIRVVENPNPAVDMQNWMEVLFEHQQHVRVRDIVIPGTHQSATYDLNTSSDIAPGQTGFINVVKSDIAAISKAGSHTVYDQLRDGIRFLDLRPETHEGRYVQVHGLVGSDMEEVFDDVARFHAQNPKEIIIIEVDRAPDKKEDRYKMAQMIREKIGHAMLPNPSLDASNSPDVLTVEKVWQTGKPIIVKLVENDTGFDFWPQGSTLR